MSWAWGIAIPIKNRAGEVVATFRVDAEDAWAQDHAWTLKKGYVCRTARDEDGRMRNVSLHREIMGLIRGDGLEVDHINGDPLDNRRANLRVCSRRQNMQNVQRTRVGAASAFRGVFREEHGNKPWRARHILDGKRIHIGWFATEEEAAEAASAWRAVHMPYSTEGIWA